MFDSAADFHPGINDPSPVTRVLILGYYDGATDGVLQLADGERVYRFDLSADSEMADQRQFLLRPLESATWNRLVAMIGEYIPPRWPSWMPVWRFPNPEIREAVEQEVDAILNTAGAVEWIISTDDLSGFSSVVATRYRQSGSNRESAILQYAGEL